MLRQEDAIRVVCPTGTSLPDVIGTEAVRKVSASYCTANVFDNLLMTPSVTSTPPVAQPHKPPIGRQAGPAPPQPGRLGELPELCDIESNCQAQ